MKPSKNYAKFVDEMTHLSGTDLDGVRKFIAEAEKLLSEIDDVGAVRLIQDKDELLRGFNKLMKSVDTEKICPRCGHKLMLSDLPQYDYVCPECDENF